jgi:hypothetical protein
MAAVSRLGAHVIAQESIQAVPQEVEPDLSYFDMWKGMLDKTLTSFKIIMSQRRRIRDLELCLEIAHSAMHEVEQVIMEFGDSKESSKTLRHKLLRIVDEKYNQKTDFSI